MEFLDEKIEIIENLKPCPFCGGRATGGEITKSPDGKTTVYMIACGKCGASFVKVGKEKIIKDWNRRDGTAEHRADIFERMAFKLQEERELLVWVFKKLSGGCGFCECDVCVFGEQFEKCGDANVNCGDCERKEKCPCGQCRKAQNFVFSAERAKRLRGNGNVR